MTTRITKLTATAGAAVLSAGLGTVAATSASAASPPAPAAVATRAVPANVPVPMNAPNLVKGDPSKCDGIYLLGICLKLDLDLSDGSGSGGGS
jgi:hypothetical protein